MPAHARDERPRRRHRAVLVVAVVAAAGLLVGVGTWPTGVDAPFRAELHRVIHAMQSQYGFVTYGFVDFFANVLWFVPATAIATVLLGRRRWFMPLLGAVVLSVGIELVQSSMLAERVGSLADVTANAVGAALGVLIGVAIDQHRELRRCVDPSTA